MARPDGPYLYLATDGVLSKIGITSNVERRMRSLRSPIKAGAVSLVEAWNRPDDYRWLEEYIIGQFPVSHEEEWFAVDPALVKTRVLRALAIVDRPANRCRFKNGQLI